MSFVNVLDEVIIMAGNNLKTFEQHESTVGSDNKGIAADKKHDAHVAVKNSSENKGLEEHLDSLSDHELRNIALLALYGKGDGENFVELKDEVDAKDRRWYLESLKKTTQYLYLGKRLAEKRNVNLEEL